MKNYLKDKKIQLWRTTYTTNANGFNETTESKIADLWAYYRHTSARERWEAMAVQYEADAVFIVNNNRGFEIDPKTDYIMFQGKAFDIHSVDDYEGNSKDLKIGATMRK